MYKIQNRLIYDNQLVGLRLSRTRDGQHYDLDIDRLGGKFTRPTYLADINTITLVEKDGLLMSKYEASGSMKPVPSLPEDDLHDKLVKKLFLTSHTREECKEAVRICVDKIVKYKNLGVSIKEVYVDGKEDFMKNDDSIRYRFGAKLKTRHKFEWNEDHDYCERHYDAFGVIDNDKDFDDWVTYAKYVAEEVAKHFGLYLYVDLEGVKYDITLDVTAYSISLTDKVSHRIR